MPNEQLEQLKEGSESSSYEYVSEPAVPDEEAGYKKSTKVKPKLTANCEASTVSTFDLVEGKKKFIAFLCVSCVTLYSYGVDSFIKLFLWHHLMFVVWRWEDNMSKKQNFVSSVRRMLLY